MNKQTKKTLNTIALVVFLLFLGFVSGMKYQKSKSKGLEYKDTGWIKLKCQKGSLWVKGRDMDNACPGIEPAKPELYEE